MYRKIYIQYNIARHEQKYHLLQKKKLYSSITETNLALIACNEIVLVVILLQTRLLTVINKEPSKSGL